MSEPAPGFVAIWQKIEILEHYLAADGSGTIYADNREIVMLASVKADLASVAGILHRHDPSACFARAQQP